MKFIISFLQNNYDWIFFGFGAGIIFWLLGHKSGYSKAINQTMKAGNNSTSIQVGGDFQVDTKKE